MKELARHIVSRASKSRPYVKWLMEQTTGVIKQRGVKAGLNYLWTIAFSIEDGVGLLYPLWSKRPSLLRYPGRIEVEVTTKCFLKCLKCEQVYWNEPQKSLTAEQIEQVLDEFPKLKAISLSGIGHNYQNPEYEKILKLCCDRSLYVQFFDTFLLLGPSRAKNLVDWGVTKVWMSIDGVDERTVALQQQGSRFMLAPEGSRWFDAILDPRNAATTDSVYLDPYDGGAMDIERVGRGEVVVDNCYLSMLVILQPEPLAAALRPDRDGRRRLIGAGTWARIAASIVGAVDPDTFDRPIPDGTGVESRYAEAVQREFLRSFGREEPLQFELDAEARKEFGAIYDRIERVKVDATALRDTGGMAEAWGKAAGRALRFARVFTQIEMTDAGVVAPGVKSIGAAAVRDGWRIAEWFLASAAHGMGGAAPVTDEALAARCLGWLRKRLKDAGTAGVQFRKLHDNARHRPYLRGAIDALVAAGEVGVSPGPISSATVTATVTLQLSA